MRFHEYLVMLSEEFHKRLEMKTGWGKNEVKQLFQDCREHVLLEVIKRETDI